MNQIIVKNILTVEAGMVGQQVNCRRIAGGGLARQTAARFPAWETWYRRTLPVLGTATFYSATPSLILANLYGQTDIGPGLQTDYKALSRAIGQAAKVADQYQLNLYLPYLIGCGLAGGDWAVVKAIIENVAPDAILCQLPGIPYDES